VLAPGRSNRGVEITPDVADGPTHSLILGASLATAFAVRHGRALACDRGKVTELRIFFDRNINMIYRIFLWEMIARRSSLERGSRHHTIAEPIVLPKINPVNPVNPV